MALASRVYLDTNILISVFEGKDEMSVALRDLLVVENPLDKPLFVTSALTFAELLVIPIREKDEELVLSYRAWSMGTRHLEVVPVAGDVLFNAAACRARYASLKLPDAIHIATASGMKCSRMLTYDKRLVAYTPSFNPGLIGRSLPVIRIERPDMTVIDELKQLLS